MEVIGSVPICPYCSYDQRTRAALTHHLPPGTILKEKYLVGKVLGQGGFGITYLAWDMTLDLKIAIKEFFPLGLVARSAGSLTIDVYEGNQKEQFIYGLDRFLSEAKILARFSEHPNIITVRDFFRANNTAYMIMNFINGRTLEEHLKKAGGKIPFPIMLEIMMPVMDSLRELHQTKFMHRDISPDNIFICDNGRVVLIDFGAARQDLQIKSRSLSVIMKVGYSPEEQYRSRGEQGPWTDIYAVAATIYRGITGIVPPESMDRLEEDTIHPPSLLGIEISEENEQTLMKALAVKSRDRFQSVEELQSSFTDRSIKVQSSTEQKAPQVSMPETPSEITSQEINMNSAEHKFLKNSVPIESRLNALRIHKINPFHRIVKLMALTLVTIIILASSIVFAYYYVTPYDMYFNPNEIALTAGGEYGYYNLIVKPFFSNKNNLTWEIISDNDQSADLSEMGVVKPLEAGITTVKVSSSNRQVSAVCRIIIEHKTIPWADGLYTGELKNGIPHGQGMWSNENGEIIQGRWEFGEILNPNDETKTQNNDDIEEWFPLFPTSDIKFFSGFSDVTFSSYREYDDNFSVDVNYVCWEYTHSYPVSNEDGYISIMHHYYDSDWSMVDRQAYGYFLRAGTSEIVLSGGYGHRYYRKFSPGLYYVVLFIDGEEVASGNFRVEP